MTTVNKGGRPTKLTKKLMDMAEEYLAQFETDKKTLPKREGLALHLGVGRTTMYTWERDENTPVRFRNTLERLELMQAQRLIDLGLNGTYNPTITKLMLHNCGYTEKTTVDHQSSDRSMTPSTPPAPVVIELIAQPIPDRDEGDDE